MDVFKLMGRIVIDGSGASGEIDNIAKKAGNASRKINASFNKIEKAFTGTVKGVYTVGRALNQVGETVERAGRTIARGITIGATAVSAAAVTIGKSALDIRSSIEQGLGGADAVFQQYAHHIKDSSKDAWKTAGLSMEEYLATANKMGSLFKGAGFTEMQAVEYTANAMQRAADVASIMGIDISAAMESIAGAAKGNFTMMDNLGVAMNETTLEAYRLEKGFDKAVSKMTTAEKVELAMQMFFDRTADYAGNYAKENETAAGSLQTLKAAWSNFLGNVGTFEDLEQSAFGYLRIAAKTMGLEGLEPMITGAQQTVEEVAEILSMEGLDGRQKFAKIRRYLLDKSVALANALGEKIPQGIDKASTLISETLSDINVDLPHFMSVGMDILTSIRNGIKAAAAMLSVTGSIVAPNIVAGWIGLKSDFIAIGLDILGSIAEGIAEDLALGEESKIGTSLKEGLNNVLDSLVINLPKLGTLATRIIDGIADALKSTDLNGTSAGEKAGEAVGKLIDEILIWIDGGGVGRFTEAATEFLMQFGAKLVEKAPEILKGFATGVWDGLTGIFDGIKAFFSDEDTTAIEEYNSALGETESSFQWIIDNGDAVKNGLTAVGLGLVACFAAAHPFAAAIVSAVGALQWLMEGGFTTTAEAITEATGGNVDANRLIKNTETGKTVSEEKKQQEYQAALEVAETNLDKANALMNYLDNRAPWQKKLDFARQQWSDFSHISKGSLAWLDVIFGKGGNNEISLHDALPSADAALGEIVKWWNDIDPDLVVEAGIEPPNFQATEEEFRAWWKSAQPKLQETITNNLPDANATGDEIANWYESVDPELFSSIGIELPSPYATVTEILEWWEKARPQLVLAYSVVPSGSGISTPSSGGSTLFESSSGGSYGGVDGSFATGISFVPRDNLLARLHQGEAVLTANEASEWRQQKNGYRNLENAVARLTNAVADLQEGFNANMNLYINKRHVASAMSRDMGRSIGNREYALLRGMGG